MRSHYSGTSFDVDISILLFVNWKASKIYLRDFETLVFNLFKLLFKTIVNKFTGW